ncbi:putative candidate secreted effector protein [Blumeria hordei DH14]|uniref:Putative candidate secreted effector protein n=1 Tax=Blumeria graminis f. sp. hordei (strain DH14) TaxID=546991 RepID=N1JQZ2_BLUG1|nr:putative candidate secreted effector protein [Blumeria hordei DH14]
MKFFSSASSAALACLLLLVPVVLGGPHFRCSNGQKFKLLDLQDKSPSFLESNARDGDPLHPDGFCYPTHRLTKKSRGGQDTEYLFQLIDGKPTFHVYMRESTQFKPCPFNQD